MIHFYYGFSSGYGSASVKAKFTVAPVPVPQHCFSSFYKRATTQGTVLSITSSFSRLAKEPMALFSVLKTRKNALRTCKDI